MSQVYSTYTGTKPVEQLASGDGQEWLSCEVCSLTFKNQQHYSIHCGGTFHANRVAASIRTQQTSTKTSSQEDPQAAFASSNNPSYWTGMQQAFSFAPSQQQHNPSSQKLANRSQSGQGQLNTSADAYQGQMEYVSYPVGKQTKPPSDSKATGGYEGLYGMPGFGWSDGMQPDSSKFNYQSQPYPAAAQLPELQQMKVSSASKPALHDAWKNYQPQPESSGGIQAGKDFGSEKAFDYGYSTQEVAAYSSQKSDVPSWMKIIEPTVAQKTESYKSSNKSALYGSRDAFPTNASSTRSTEREDPWKSAPNYETDVRAQIRQTKEGGSYGKTEQVVRSKTRWDTDDSLSREGKQHGGGDGLDRQNTGGRRREDKDSFGRGGYQDSKERSNSRTSDDSYRKRESSRWEDARERDSSSRKHELDVRDGSKRHDESSYKDMSLYGTKRTTDTREIGSNAEVGKGREDSSGWDSSYTGQVSAAGYTNRRDVPFSSKAGRNENVQLRDQGVVNKAAGKQDIQQFGQTESWDAYGQGWQTGTPDASSRKQEAVTLDKKTGYDQQRKTSWGGETVQGKTDTSWRQPEGYDVWDATYVASTAGGGNSWSAESGYASAGFSSKAGQNEKTLAQGRADKGSWNQKETGKNSFGQLQGGNTWPIANSGHGVGDDLRRSSGIAGEQEWRSVNDVLATFKQASKVPDQKASTNVGSSAYGDLNQELSSYAVCPLPAAKFGERTSDPKVGYDWNWTHGAKDKQLEYGEYNEQEYATPSDPYHHGVSEWSGSYTAGRGGLPQSGLRDANKVGQKVAAAAANQWTGWPNTEPRADVRGSGSFAKDQQQANQAGGLGRGQSGFQEVKGLGRGVGYGRSQVKEIEKPVGLSRSADRTEKQDWARPFSHGAQGLPGKTPDVSSGTTGNASWLRAQEVSVATNAGRGVGRGGGGGRGGGDGRGSGRGVVGNKPMPELGGWRQGFQEQGKLPSASAGRGGPIRGSESSSSLLGQKDSWGFGLAGVKPAAPLTKGFEKDKESKFSSNLQEKMRQLSEQPFKMDWSEKGKDWQESGKSVQTPVAAPGQRNSSIGAPGQSSSSIGGPGQRNSSIGASGQRNSSIGGPGQSSSSIGAPGQRNSSIGGPGQRNSSDAAGGQRTNQTRSSVPSLLNLNVAPTGKPKNTAAGIEDRHSRDAANSMQKSSGAMQPPSSAFGGKKPEQSPASTKLSGSAIAQPVTTASKQEFVAPSMAKNVSSNLNRPLSQQSVKVQPPATSVPDQKTVTPMSHLLPTPSMQPQNQNKPSTSVQAVIKKPLPGPTTVTNVVIAQGKGVTVSGQGKSVTVSGQGQGVTVSGQGQGVTVSGQGQGVTVSGQGKGVTVGGQGQGVTVSGQSQGVTVSGQGQGVTNVVSGQGKGVTVSGQGQGVTVSGQGKGVTVSGQGQGLIVSGQGKGVTVSGQGKGVTVGGQGQGVTVSGQGVTVGGQGQGVTNVRGQGQGVTISGQGKGVTNVVRGQGQGNFDRLDPASARKTGSTGDNKQKVTTLVSSSSSVVSLQTSVTAKQTVISNVVPSKELAESNITRSASKLDSKVAPATAAETKTGLKSSNSQLHSNCPPVTSSSSAAAQPVITAKPAAALASSTANTPRLDSSKKPVAQKNVTVAPARDKKKEDADNDDECDPALSEALGQFFSEDVPSATAKPAVPAKKTAGSTKFVPTIRTYAVKSLAGFSKENPSGGKNDSNEDNAKKSEQTKKPTPATIAIKVEKDDFISPGKDDGKAEGKAGDPVSALSKWLPPNLLKGIASGHLSKELLEKVADLVPADALKQAVEYLQDSSKIQPLIVSTEAKELQRGLQPAGGSVDATSKTKADEEKSKMKVVDSAKMTGKPVETTSRVQVIQPRKGLSNPTAVGSATAKGPVTGSNAKTPVDVTGINKQPGSLASAVKPPVLSCAAVPSKRKYEDIDLAKLKNLTFDEMLQLFQELLKDVLGSLFEEDQKPSAISEKKILDGLSVKDREMALKVRQTTGITDLSRITHTMNVLKSLNAETIEALGQLDKSIIASSLSGNERAQKRGVTVLQQITELIMAKGASDAKQIGGGPQVPVGRGRGSVRPPPQGLSSGRGVQSLLTLNLADNPKVGALSAATSSATRPLLPTPHFPQRPRFSMGGMMATQGMGLLPMPAEQAHLLNFPQPRFLRKRGPPLQSDSAFFGSAPPFKRWR